MSGLNTDKFTVNTLYIVNKENIKNKTKNVQTVYRVYSTLIIMYQMYFQLVCKLVTYTMQKVFITENVQWNCKEM